MLARLTSAFSPLKVTFFKVVEMEKVVRRGGSVSESQKNVLIEFMKQHAELQSGRFTTSFTQTKARELWRKITEELNSMLGGTSKDWKQWRRTWADLKRNTKQKASEAKKSMKKTGGGEPIEGLTQNENEILSLLSPCLTDGHEGIKETNICFDFDSDIPFHSELGDVPLPHENENDIRNVEEEHSYTVTEPLLLGCQKTRALRGKQMTATRRHITALKLNQNLISTIEQKNDMMSEYYNKKMEFMEFKKQYYEEKKSLLRERNETEADILSTLRQIAERSNVYDC